MCVCDNQLQPHEWIEGVCPPDANMERRLLVLQDIDHELNRQIDKWGEQHHPNGTSENYAPRREFYRDRCDERFGAGEGSWFDILLEEVYEAAAETDDRQLRKELVQVAAVAAAWTEDIDSRR